MLRGQSPIAFHLPPSREANIYSIGEDGLWRFKPYTIEEAQEDAAESRAVFEEYLKKTNALPIEHHTIQSAEERVVNQNKWRQKVVNNRNLILKILIDQGGRSTDWVFYDCIGYVQDIAFPLLRSNSYTLDRMLSEIPRIAKEALSDALVHLAEAEIKEVELIRVMAGDAKDVMSQPFGFLVKVDERAFHLKLLGYNTKKISEIT